MVSALAARGPGDPVPLAPRDPTWSHASPALSPRGDAVAYIGSGPTGAVAKRLGRGFIGIERDPRYAQAARARINAVPWPSEDATVTVREARAEPRIPFGWVVERGLLSAGDVLTDARGRHAAKVRADGSLVGADITGSIHKVGAHVQGLSACNGWTFWHVVKDGKLICIDEMRAEIRASMRD